jgi:hypothetical protein
LVFQIKKVNPFYLDVYRNSKHRYYFILALNESHWNSNYIELSSKVLNKLFRFCPWINKHSCTWSFRWDDHNSWINISEVKKLQLNMLLVKQISNLTFKANVFWMSKKQNHCTECLLKTTFFIHWRSIFSPRFAFHKK